MTTEKEKIADRYFKCTKKERTAFELGIKLGSLFHQFIGSPVSEENADILARAMEKTTERQAYVKSAHISINLEKSKDEKEEGIFEYTTLTEDMIEAKISVEYDGIKAEGILRYVEELNYPLMYVNKLG
ncbi:MAG: dihydroneopterin aldolase family protein [Candidatus Saliniplasma sp.]